MTLFDALRHRLAVRACERQVYAELTRLDDRALADIGLARSELRRVAHEAARRGPSDLRGLIGARADRPANDSWQLGYGFAMRAA